MDNRRVFAYLRKRGIAARVINAFLSAGLLYEDAEHHNCVFVDRNADGQAVFANKRGTYGLNGSGFKGTFPAATSPWSSGFPAIWPMMPCTSLKLLCVCPAGALECVNASSISLAPPQAAGLAHSAAFPSPTKSNDFAGTLIDTPEDSLFGRPTSDETIYEQESVNEDRSKDTALIAPAFGSPTNCLPGSGEALTPNLVPGALDGGGLMTSTGSVNYPTLDGGSSSGGQTTRYTAVTSDLYYSGGHLGTLKIPALGLSVKVYEDTDSAQLAKGAGHFTSTSIWDGNVCVAAGHNRGVNEHFGKIHTLKVGDIIILTAKLGTRTYAVTGVEKVSETDTGGTAATADNRITPFTCVMNQWAYRRQVQAVEAR